MSPIFIQDHMHLWLYMVSVSPIQYHLVIVALSKGLVRFYESLVVCTLWLSFKYLENHLLALRYIVNLLLLLIDKGIYFIS